MISVEMICMPIHASDHAFLNLGNLRDEGDQTLKQYISILSESLKNNL